MKSRLFSNLENRSENFVCQFVEQQDYNTFLLNCAADCKLLLFFTVPENCHNLLPLLCSLFPFMIVNRRLDEWVKLEQLDLDSVEAVVDEKVEDKVVRVL